VRADVTTTATAGGVLVAVTLCNDTAVAVRVRVDNDLDGPVLPPRREGVPTAGWDEDGFTGTVPANGRAGIGYACPVGDGGAADRAASNSKPNRDSDPDPDAEAISLEVLGPADGDEPSESDRVDAAVRSLGRATPPADAVPASPIVDPDGSAADRQSSRRDDPDRSGTSDVPAPVARWLDAIESRVRRAERLTDATADEASAVLEDCGGTDAVATLPGDHERDLASLRAVGDRIEELTARAADADPEPVASSLVDAAGGEAPGGADGSDSAARRVNGAAESTPGVRR
jgi:hypothetical protein